MLETSALQDLTATADIMRACREMGVRFALDDPDDLAIVQGIMGLAAAFRREVIAEGVETQADSKRLLAMGCELAQGYGIARPMPAQALPDWLAHWRPDPSWTTWQQRTLSRDDMSAVFIEVGHRHWLRSLEAYLQDPRHNPPPLSDSECHFGRWQQGEGQLRYGMLAQFKALVDLHNRIHGMAQAMVETAQRAPSAPPDHSLEELRQLLHELSRGLRDLVRP